MAADEESEVNDLMTRWRNLRPVGFWKSDFEPQLPHPRDFVDPNWDSGERAAVLAYLAKGIRAPFAYCGFSWCRLCERGPFSRFNGKGEFTDGTWRWPEGLTHYLLDHLVKPDGEFVAWVLSHAGSFPQAREWRRI